MQILYYFIVFLSRALNFAIFARIILSWIPIDRESPIVRIILEITEPIIGPIRRVMPSMGGFDFSPMIALLLIQVAERVLVSILFRA